MRIAFYAPLKSPDHPVPSGDRLMARLLLAALSRGGHEATVVSGVRAFLRDREAAMEQAAIIAATRAAQDHIAAGWQTARPDVFLSYHPYYKAPDRIGPALCARFGVPYVTIETSYSARRNIGLWAGQQALVAAGAAQAAVNICLTARDERGLREAIPGIRTARLAPFIAVTPGVPVPGAGHLVTVAMMRPGDKMDSYTHLAAALALVPGDWRLSVAGDGEMRPEVEALFAPFGARVQFLGRLEAGAVQALLARGAVYVWPGCGEAYGLAYLEAQAAGLPVVAFDTAGVPEVVANGIGGRLVAMGDDTAFAGAVAGLLADSVSRDRMASAAQERVHRVHSLEAAAVRLDTILRQAVAA